MSGASVQMIFCPQNCSLERLNATLTDDRRALADRILDQVEASVDTGASHNSLLVGPRGTGKTHVLAYVRKTLEQRNDVKVLALSEEERGLASLLDFLLACLRAGGISKDEVLARLYGKDPLFAVEEADLLFGELTGNRPTVIIVENLSDVLDSLGEDALSQLRGFLQEHAFVSVLASSVALFTESSSPDHPFHGYFMIHPLKALERKQARSYLGLLAKANGDADLAAVLRKGSAQARVNAIFDLTGGNHRLLAMLNNFLTVDGFNELVGPFVQMADRELTPYYQQRLDRLSPQQYKILQAVADQHGRALSVNEIAHHTFLSPQSVSRQLHDLLHGGYVARMQVGRESCYELREPLLRLILDMKQGRDRLLPLIVNLLRQWYEAKELRELLVNASGPGFSYYQEALEGAAQDLLEEGIALFEKKEYAEALKRFEALIELEPDNPSAWFNKALSLTLLGRLEESIRPYDEVVRVLAEWEASEELEALGKALTNKGAMLQELGRLEEALAAYDEAVRRLGESESPAVIKVAAAALVNKGLTLAELGRPEAAVSVYDQVVCRFGESDQRELLKQVAMALYNKAIALDELGEHERAAAAYDDVVKRFGGRAELVEDLLQLAAREPNIRAPLAGRLICFSVQNEALLREVARAYSQDARALAGGLVEWLRWQLPLSKADAEKLEEAERALRSVLGNIPETQPALDMLNAARRHAMGERKALLDLPVELRRLILQAEGSDEE